MLIRDFAYAETSLADAVAAVAQGAPGWLGPLAVGAAAAGEAVRLRIGPATAVPGLSTVAMVRLGEPASFGDGVVIPITWEAAHVRGAFPVLDGELELAPMGQHRVQLTLTGRYEPPLGAIGRRLDQVILHRVAEASVRDFLQRVASALEPRPERASAGSQTVLQLTAEPAGD